MILLPVLNKYRGKQTETDGREGPDRFPARLSFPHQDGLLFPFLQSKALRCFETIVLVLSPFTRRLISTPQNMPHIWSRLTRTALLVTELLPRKRGGPPWGGGIVTNSVVFVVLGLSFFFFDRDHKPYGFSCFLCVSAPLFLR